MHEQRPQPICGYWIAGQGAFGWSRVRLFASIETLKREASASVHERLSEDLREENEMPLEGDE